MYSLIPGKTSKIMGMCIEAVKQQENSCLSPSISGEQCVLPSNYATGRGNLIAVFKRKILLVIIHTLKQQKISLKPPVVDPYEYTGVKSS